MGVIASPNFYSHYSYLEARNSDSIISIGDNVAINNAFSAVAFQSIMIQENVLIGINFAIIDNDGHDLASDKRTTANPKSEAVTIEKNVFIGDKPNALK